MTKLYDEAEDSLGLDRNYSGGHRHFCNVKTLQYFLDVAIHREPRTVDVPFMEKYLTLIAQAMAEENFERLMDIVKMAHRESLLISRKAGLTRSEAMALPLTMTKISLQTLVHLEHEGVTEVSELIRLRPEEFRKLPQMGPNTLKECQAALLELGFDDEGRYHGIGG